MSSLLSLPDEILLAIISYFSLDGYLIDIARPTLYALSLVSKRLYRLATHCLYRFILIHRTHDNGASRKYNLILRSVKNNAELGTKVHTLVLVCDYSLRGRNPQELLTCLPNLRKLDLEAGAYDDRFDHRFYLPPPATACHYVLDLKISKPSKQDLPYLLIQCRIHDLKLDITGLSNLRFITPTPSDQARKASLQSLVLSPSSRISINAFQNLMSYPAFLLHLKIPLPGVVRERSNCFLQQAKFSYPLSPKAISHALSPTFKTLESLDLEGGTLFPGHDGSTFSMTSFQKLKAATIPAELFFSKRSQSTSLDQLLPRSLMSLEIHFDSSGHIPPSLSWLSSLASHKPSHTPVLAHVKIVEVDYEPSHHECFTDTCGPEWGNWEYDGAAQRHKWVPNPDCPPMSVYWKPPLWLAEEFDKQGVKLEMEVGESMGKAMSGEQDL